MPSRHSQRRRGADFEHTFEIEEADHAAWQYDHAVGIARPTRNVHLRHRLDKTRIDREDIGHAVNDETDRCPVSFGHDDGAAFIRHRTVHAELAGEIDNGDHGATQIHDSGDVSRGMGDRR